MSRRTSKEDLGILDSILDAIATGRFPALAEAESEFRALRVRVHAGTASSSDGLHTLLSSHSDRMVEAVVAQAEETLAYVREQIDRFARLEEERPLTMEEKRFGKETLLGLLDSLGQLLLSTHSDRMVEVVVAQAEETLAYVREQIDRFARLKKERPLTMEEKRFGKETLLGLLDSLGQLLSDIRVVRHRGSEAGPGS